MEIQIKSQQVLKDIAGDFPDGLLRNTCKYCIAQLLEKRRSNSSRAI